MGHISMALIGLSAVGFLLAVVTSLANSWTLGVGPEGFSRTCNNLALIAIALAAWFRNEKR